MAVNGEGALWVGLAGLDLVKCCQIHDYRGFQRSKDGCRTRVVTNVEVGMVRRQAREAVSSKRFDKIRAELSIGTDQYDAGSRIHSLG